MWFIAGFLLTLSLGGSTHLAGQLGLAGVIFVLLYFVLVILPSESNRIAFFVGVFEGQEGYNHIGCIWAIPFVLVIWAIIIAAVRAIFGWL